VEGFRNSQTIRGKRRRLPRRRQEQKQIATRRIRKINRE
jgi:hypothetical protein